MAGRPGKAADRNLEGSHTSLYGAVRGGADAGAASERGGGPQR